MKKRFVIIFVLCFFSCFVFSEEDESASDINLYEIENAESETKSENENEIEEKKTARKFDFVVRMSPALELSLPEEKIVSAPSPVFFMPGFGISIPSNALISFEPSINLFYSYFLWYDKMPYPAEMEMRTAAVFSMLFDLPASITFGKEKYRYQIKLGAAPLLRFAFLPGGVSADEKGNSGTVADDINLINKFFWSDFKFMYLSFAFSFLYNFSDNAKFGPFLESYIPLGRLISENKFDGAIFTLGVKIVM